MCLDKLRLDLRDAVVQVGHKVLLLVLRFIEIATITAADLATRTLSVSGRLEVAPYSRADKGRALELHRGMNAGTSQQASPFLAFAVSDHSGQRVGTILRTTFFGAETTEKLWWTVAANGEVTSVQTVSGSIHETTRVSIGALDRSVEELEQCATPGEVALLDAKLLAHALHDISEIRAPGEP